MLTIFSKSRKQKGKKSWFKENIKRDSKAKLAFIEGLPYASSCAKAPDILYLI